jgi:hypothetical protein
MRGTGHVKMAMKWVAGVLVAMDVVIAAGAQGVPTATPKETLEIAVTYTAGYAGLTSGKDNFWLQGGSAELSFTSWHGLGESADVTGLNVANSGHGVPVNLVTTTFGPRYTWTVRRRSQHNLRLFGEGLVGIANGFSGYYPQSGNATDSASSLALQIGGGADYALNKHFALRMIRANWLRTQLLNATTNVQNNLTLGAGIVFRIP